MSRDNEQHGFASGEAFHVGGIFDVGTTQHIAGRTAAGRHSLTLFQDEVGSVADGLEVLLQRGRAGNAASTGSSISILPNTLGRPADGVSHERLSVVAVGEVTSAFTGLLLHPSQQSLETGSSAAQ